MTSHAVVLGIHHVTAIAGDAQRNVDFYAGVLGLRLVKRTVNFDDPRTYHLYYGDGEGRPGSILTFFPWPRGARGRQGRGQVAVTSFAVLPGAIGFWVERLVKHGVAFEGPVRRGDEQALAFRDHDGLMLEIVAHAGAEGRAAWDGAGIPERHALRGFHAVTLWEERGEETERLLVDALGFRRVDEGRDGTRRFAAGDGGPGRLVDVRTVGGFLRGVDGVGAVHHVAWRAPDDAGELAIRERVVAAGLAPTPVIDRQYFHSVYFREPGGVLFEIATDPPGFTVDEPLAELGTGLRLPPRYETMRAELERSLPALHVPSPAAAGAPVAT